MAYTTLDICNSALIKIGDRPINSLDDDLQQARVCKVRYAPVFDAVLSMYPFSCALARAALVPDADYVKVSVYDYRFSLPNDCLHIWDVLDPDDDKLYEFSQEGQKVLANYPTVSVVYSRRITGTGVVDHDVAELLSYYLAWDMSQRLDPDVQRTARLRDEFERFFSRIRTVDSQRRAPRYYGEGDPFNKDTNDHPSTWVDTRL